MFLIILKYKVPIDQVERVTPAHREFLGRAYEADKLLVSGPQVPRTGGVIVARINTREEVDAFIHNDPYFKEGIADYDVIEFAPRSFHSAIASLV
jgi:uncharacterized protein YciI